MSAIALELYFQLVKGCITIPPLFLDTCPFTWRDEMEEVPRSTPRVEANGAQCH